MDFFAGEANVGGCWLRVLFGNARKVVTNLRYFAALLGRVVLVGDATFCERLDLQCVKG